MPCPDREQLRAFLRGAAPEGVAAHVIDCEACLALLPELASVDSFAQQVQQAAREEPFTEEECQEAIAPVEALGPDPAHAPALAPLQPEPIPPTVPSAVRRLGNYELIERVTPPAGKARYGGRGTCCVSARRITLEPARECKQR
jgi:hypothetical protein